MRLSAMIIALLASFFGHLPAAHAQERGHWRSGIVVDESGAGISSARLIVRSAQGSGLRDAATAADGTFTLGPLPTGSYWLDVAAREFAGRRLELEISGGETTVLRIVLSLAPFSSDVTVTAERGAVAEIDRTPSIVTVRKADEFRGRPLTTIGDALEGATGVTLQQSTTGQVSPFLRGLTGYQVLSLVDGIRFNNTTFRSGPNQYAAFVDPSQAHRIEARLGPASAQFGSDAMGGIVQILTPDIDFRGTAGSLVKGGVNLFGGSANRSLGGDATIFLRGRSATGIVGASRRSHDDLRAGGGRDSHHVLRRFFGLNDEQIQDVLGDRQKDTGFTQSGVHAKLAARLGSRQNLTAWFQQGQQDDVRGYKDLWGGLGRLRSDFVPQQLRFFYTRYERLAVGALDWLSGTFSVNAQDDGSVRQSLRHTDPIVRDDVDVDAFGYAAQAGAHIGSRHSLVFGGELYDEHVDARRDETNPVTGVNIQKRALYPNGSRYSTLGFFLQDHVSIIRGEDGQALTAQFGGRFTRVGVRTLAQANRTDARQSLGVIDSEQSYQDWTFNAAMTWALNRAVSLNGLVSRGFRAPNLNDLGALGLNDLGYEVPASSVIDAGALIGGSDGEGALSTGRAVGKLTSERLFNYELGVAMNWAGGSARLQGFDAELLDPIVRRSLAFPLDSPPSTLAGVPVAPIAPTAAQRAQGVVNVAPAVDARAVKAFVNEGRARYYGIDALLRHRLTTRWSIAANYSYLVGHDLEPTRPIRRLPPQHGLLAVRYQPRGFRSWIEASAVISGPQKNLSGGDLTDERIGASRRRSDISDFFQGGLISPFILPGADGRPNTADDVFGATGETAAQIRDRVLPIGATINGVTVVNDGTRVPLYTSTPGFLSMNVRAGVAVTDYFDLNLALMNILDRNYRVHGSGVDAPGVSVFAGLRASF
jgi:hemoglobin/transferrin/lactoferrin receptor protein